MKNANSFGNFGLRSVAGFLAATILLSCSYNSNAGDKLKEENPDSITGQTGGVDEKASQGRQIRIALLLDTSNSMDGLIEQAKSQLWKLVNELAKAKCDTVKPDLRIALYEYGNDGLNAEKGYIRKVSALTDDLDKISEDLFRLSTNGGSEHCGQVIRTSVNELEWATNGDDLQIIFIAGNEPFTQGPVPFQEACKEAKKKNIIVNTIYCGSFDEGMSGFWKAGADATGGTFMSIDHNSKTVYIESPYDDQISKLNGKLNDTYIYYGESGYDKKQSQSTQDKNAEQYGMANTVERTISKSSRVYKNSTWDLVDASKEKTFDITKVEKQQLPEEMRGMTAEQMKKYISDKEKERTVITTEIQTLSKKRETFIIERQKEQANTDAKMLDNVMINAVKSQAKSKNMTFEK